MSRVAPRPSLLIDGNGPNRYESYKRIAVYVDTIFKGTEPADLPVELPTRFELVISLPAASRSAWGSAESAGASGQG